MRVFARSGYYGASTSAIAALADVPQPHVYANFSSKSELFLSCLEIACQAALGSVKPNSRNTSNPASASETVSTPKSSAGPLSYSNAEFTDEHAALIAQAITAVHSPELVPQALLLLSDLRQHLGETALSAIYFRALAFLLP